MSALESYEICPVNIVVSGELDVEVDLQTLSTDIPQAQYDPDNYHGLYFRFDEDLPLITLYRSGKYIITGAKSETQLKKARTHVFTELHRVGLLNTQEVTGFRVQNIVCQADMGGPVNLNAVMIALGMEDTEYEPEQFSGPIYRPSSFNCVLLIFSSHSHRWY
jgi:transcription initiation factor TFIID TATA-box-binding protein